MLASSSSPLLHCLSQSVPTCTSRCFSHIRPVVFPYIQLFFPSVNSSSSSLSFIYTSFFIILHSRALQPLLYLLFILLFFIILHSRGTWRRARLSHWIRSSSFELPPVFSGFHHSLSDYRILVFLLVSSERRKLDPCLAVTWLEINFIFKRVDGAASWNGC